MMVNHCDPIISTIHHEDLARIPSRQWRHHETLWAIELICAAACCSGHEARLAQQRAVGECIRLTDDGHLRGKRIGNNCRIGDVDDAVLCRIAQREAASMRGQPERWHRKHHARLAARPQAHQHRIDAEGDLLPSTGNSPLRHWTRPRGDFRYRRRKDFPQDRRPDLMDC
jgi:hypothetical protein